MASSGSPLPTSSRQSSSPSHTARLHSASPSVYASTSTSTDDYSPTSHVLRRVLPPATPVYTRHPAALAFPDPS